MSIAPPRPRDLPLNALRAFEAAARLGGFAAAGAELGVTPGAISAHIKTLEDTLGAPLFTRGARGVVVSPLGARVLPAFTAAFDALGHASQTLRAEAAPHVVHIATLPAIAQLWLSPRLPELRAAMPDIAVSITALEAPPNPKRTPYDLCLFPSRDRGICVAQDVIFPVCAPQLATTLRSPGDLREAVCLTDTTWSEDWTLWAAHALPGQDFTPRGPVYSLYALALEETVNGAGVLMGHGPLVARHLAAGTLVAPFDIRVAMPQDLRLWATRAQAGAGPIRQVMTWLNAG